MSRLSLRRGLVVVIVAAGVALLVDGLVWSFRNRRLLEGLKNAGAVRIGSLFDWPIGKEYRAVFIRPPSDDEWSILQQAIALRPRNTMVYLAFPKGEIGPDRLRSLRSTAGVRFIEVEADRL